MCMISVMEWLDNYLRNLLVDKSMEFGIASCSITCTRCLTVPCIGTLQSSYSGKKSSMVEE